MLFARMLCLRKSFLTTFLIFAIFFLFYFFADKPVAQYCHDLNMTFDLRYFTDLTYLGSMILVLFLIGILLIYYQYFHYSKLRVKQLLFLFSGVLFANLITGFLKVFFGRARPFLYFQENLYGFYGWNLDAHFWSFPSGHTMTIMSLIWGLCFLMPRHAFYFILLGLMVAITRLFLSMHYLSDVFFSIYLSFLMMSLMHQWCFVKSVNLFAKDLK